ncbi:MAG TPA: type II secretion system protein, partial [Oligoflexus sp.]|uniref:PulJ/GspJ family protein n=1 Tax=Oligoflexus sp. TaxID=1971216 RepID=UPI002D507DD5
MKITHDHEAGFSIVSVLVALALISLIAVTAGQAFINSMRARAKLATKLNFEEVNQSLLKIMKNLGRNPPSSGCFTASNIAQTMAAYPFVNLSPQVTTGLTPPQLAAVSAPRHDFVATAIQRCQTSKFIGNPTSSADSTMYFCVRFQQDL